MTETVLVPQGVVKVTVKVPRVLLFEVMVNEPDPPEAIVTEVGETVRLLGPLLVTVPLPPVRTIVTVTEPPFLRIDVEGGVT